MDTAVSFVNFLMKDYAKELNMSFGQFRNLRVVGEPAEMLWNLLGHKGERVSDKTIMGRLPYGLTNNVGD